MSNEKLYGLWRISEEPGKTGWCSTKGGRLIVSHNPEDFAGLYGMVAREYPGTITHDEWMDGPVSEDDQPILDVEPGPRTGPQLFEEGFLLLAHARMRSQALIRPPLLGHQVIDDQAMHQLAALANAHFEAAQTAALAAALHPKSISWQTALGLLERKETP